MVTFFVNNQTMVFFKTCRMLHIITSLGFVNTQSGENPVDENVKLMISE